MNARRILVYQGIPLLVMLLPFAWVALFDDYQALKREDGVIENLTVLFLVVAIGFCIASLRQFRHSQLPRSLRVWLMLLILGASYFALEEISYGQHLFGWEAEGTWAEINDQQETNLHNVHPIFDQLPRALLTLGILIGGVILPLYRYFRRIDLDESDRFYWQWPTLDCVTVGLLVILLRPVLGPFELEFINIGETKENLIAMFIMLYCISLRARIRQKAPAVAATRSD